MTDVLSQEYRLTPLSEVQLHPKNPRRADVEDLRESFRENGFYGAVIVQRSTGYVIAGNHRIQAAEAEGMPEVPMIWLDVDDERATKILIADNRYADKAGYDDKQLLAVVQELQGMSSLAGTGFDQEDVEDLERITGALAAQASGFLDDIVDRANQATQGGPGASDAPLEGSGVGTIKPTQYFSVSYLCTQEERSVVLKVLAHVKAESDLESAAKALVHLCEQYGAEHNLFEPEPEDQDLGEPEPEVPGVDELA
jgi:hypothetical protein